MKRVIILFLVSLIFVVAFSQVNPNNHYVRGYTKSNGTYVNGYYRTNPNSTNVDNYSTKPNVNPYTGEKGYVEPDYNNLPTTGYSIPTYDNNFTLPKSTDYNLGGSSYNGKISNSSVNWDEIIKESDRKWKEEYPKIKEENDRWWKEEYPKIKEENDRWWKEEYPKISEKQEKYFNTLTDYRGHLNNVEYEDVVDLAIKYHFKYSINDRKTIESALAKLGYSIGIEDGVFDFQTIEGIKQFQNETGVIQDGKVGALTLKMLIQQYK